MCVSASLADLPVGNTQPPVDIGVNAGAGEESNPAFPDLVAPLHLDAYFAWPRKGTSVKVGLLLLLLAPADKESPPAVAAALLLLRLPGRKWRPIAAAVAMERLHPGVTLALRLTAADPMEEAGRGCWWDCFATATSLGL